MRKLAATFLFSFLCLGVFSQKTAVFINEDADFKAGLELFQKQKYGSAQKCFDKIISSKIDPNSLVKTHAEFYSAICAIELFNKDGEYMLKHFVEAHPESPRVLAAYFYLGKHNYRKKKYKDALEWFNKVDIYELDLRDKYELYFKRGYCYFEGGNFEKAKSDFSEIKDVDTRYTSPAIYYFSHIAYTEKSLETAVQGFLKLTTNDDFKGVVPYYVSQIYYLQEKYDDVIFFATPLLDSANTKRAPEIARIIGESYYKTNRFKEAIPYLKKYEKAVVNLSENDNYELAYAYYKNGEIDNAIFYFQGAVNGKEEDTLTQNSYYHLADCYIKKGNLKSAVTSFKAAAKLNFDRDIKEDALFSYAKMTYEALFNPFNDAVSAFKLYIKEFPRSIRVDEAYRYIVNAYLTTKNYSEAIKSIEGIPNLSDELKNVYQKVCYYRAVDFYNNNQPDSAIKYFDKALVYKTEKNFTALSYYWKAEAFYKRKQYNSAIDNYKDFIASPGAINLTEYNMANYNAGYSFFQIQDYASANLWFRKYTGAKATEDNKKLNDAYNRIGDTYFMLKRYEDAASNYEQSIKINLLDIDYALYQKALTAGIQKNFDSKISDLQTLLVNYPNSKYVAPAKYDLAKTYMLAGQPDNALAYYKKVVEEFPNSSYMSKSLMQIGLIYYNKNDDDNAMVYFDKVVKNNLKSSEAMEALDFIKKIYIAKSDVDGMKKYFEDAAVNISNGALDSITFDIGKKYYAEKNCEASVREFGKYIQKFPDGIFILDANFYKAECEYRSGYADAALTGYTFIIGKNRSVFTEQSLVCAASINFKQKNYEVALNNYTALEQTAEYPKNYMEAIVGQMRCNFNLKKYDAAIAAANKVMVAEKVSADLIDEAHLITAKSLFETEKYDEALSHFEIVLASAKNERGAESIYNVAYLKYLKNDFKEAEKRIFELINLDPGYPYWMTKALILLADNYSAQNDNFQAKHTLKSVIDNTDDLELKDIAQKKLDKISELEKAQLPKLQKENIEIEFNQNQPENKQLFQEPFMNDTINK